jgi:hypothetical protein
MVICLIMVYLQNGSSVMSWHDMWNNSVRRLQSAEIFSFTTHSNITVKHAINMKNPHDIF